MTIILFILGGAVLGANTMNNHYVLFDPEKQVVGFARSNCQYPMPHSKHNFKTSTDYVTSGSNSGSSSSSSGSSSGSTSSIDVSGSNKKKNSMIAGIMNNNPGNTNSSSSSSEKHPFLPKKVKNRNNNNNMLFFNMRKNSTRLRGKSMKINAP